jgi:hypothetical protein
MNRPIGVTILAILNIVFSAFLTLSGLAVVGLSNLLMEEILQDPEFQEAIRDVPEEFLNIFPSILGGFLIFFALVGFLMAYGLFTLRLWAWYLTLILQGLSAFGNVTSLLSGNFFALLSVGISALIIYYFVQPDVKRAFGV